MKTKWVATLDAGKLKAGFQFRNFWNLLFLIALMTNSSCSNDDLEVIDDDTSIEKEPPIVEVPPVAEEEPPGTWNYQVVYTDIEPDFTLGRTKDSLALDLNNDGVIDFSLEFESTLSEDWLYIESRRNVRNQILSVTPWYAHPVPLEKDTRIYKQGYTQGETYESSSVFAVGGCTGGGSGCNEDWMSKGERYVGLRFMIDGVMYYYGWVRIQVLSSNSLVVMDYAYNALTNQPIYAGQKE